MEYKTTQKVIKIGSSIGVTIPAKEARRLGIKEGDSIILSMYRSRQGLLLKLVAKTFGLFRRH